MAAGQSGPSVITVGVKEGDVRGATGQAIQVAIDALAYRGGGTVLVGEGEYELMDAVRLRSNISLIGRGEKTIFKRRGPVAWSDLVCDADVGEKRITPTHPERFVPGMGLRTWDKQLKWAGQTPQVRLQEVSGGDLLLDSYLTEDRRAEHGGRVINYHAMIVGHLSPQLLIEGITIDAQVNDPDGVIGLHRGAAVYLYRCPDSVIRGLKVTSNPGDGIVVGKTSERCIIEDCETAHNGYYGIHPGSHSAEVTVRRCHIHHNASDGLYICWGIRRGTFVDNDIHDNGLRDLRSGISIGHKDTDNLIARNRIRRNKKFGVCFREKTEANGAHRNTLRENVIEDNGSTAAEFPELKKQFKDWEGIGCGIHISGITRDLVLERNMIRETRSGAERTQQYGICTRPGVSNVRLIGNTIEGHVVQALKDEAGALVCVEA